MSVLLNLDELLQNTVIKLKGETYEVEPMSYSLSRKFLNLKEQDTADETDQKMFELLAEYLNTNIDKKKITVDMLQSTIRNRQLLVLFQHIIDDIQGIEKK